MENINYNTLTKEQLVRAIIKLDKRLKDLEHQLNAINNFLKIDNSVFEIKKR